MMSDFRARWKGLGAFAMTEVRVQMHEFLSIMTSIVVQVIFIFFVAILSPSLLPFTIVGAMVFSVFTIGERVLNEAAYVRLDHKLNELYHASPLTAESYFLGMGMGILFAYLPPVLFLAVLGEYVHPFSALGALVLVSVLVATWVFAASVGYILSTLFRDMRAIWPYSSLLFNIFGVLPPVFYPLSMLHGTFYQLALFLPPSAATALTMHTLGMLPLSSVDVLSAALSLALESFVLFAIAVTWARKASREA